MAYLSDIEIAQQCEMKHICEIAKKADVGLVKTVADSLKPGSDVANLGAMGFNPEECYTGRSPLEAVSVGIKLEGKN